MTKVVLSKLSICECGFSVLKDSIPLGKEYLIHEDEKVEGILVCGGCNQRIPVMLVPVAPQGVLPLEIFEAV